jgi:cytochrome c553
MKLIAPLLVAAFVAVSSFSAVASDAKPEAAAPAKVAKPDLVKGEASYGAVCAACHGADGNSGTPAYPKLAQQHPEYLVKQLQEFKSGKRNNAVMKGFATALSDEDMKNISFWVTSKKAKAGFAKDKELVTLGERIYRGGISDRQVPACAGCHSPNGAGLPSQYPRLSGQHAEYGVAQLVAFRDGTRKNSLQMTQVAAKMNDREIKAVADYIAGLR